MIGRFSSYPGYGYNKDSIIQMLTDYPYDGPDLNALYYHHIPVQLSVDTDFLVTQIWKWSNGKISFPWVRQQGYAYFSNREYGFEAGSVFDEKDMWMWLKKGIVEVDNIQIDWLEARKDGRFAAAFINEDSVPQTALVTLGDEVTGGKVYNSTATVYDADGRKTLLPVQDSKITLTVPGHGLIAIALDSDAVKKPAYADVPAQELFNSSEEGNIAVTGPTTDFGKGMVLQIDPDSYFAYVYTTFLPTQASKAVLYWHNGDGGWQQVEDGTYPYEFTVKMEDVSKPFHYSIKVLDSNGNWLTSNEAMLKPKVYLAKVKLEAEKTALKVDGETPFSITAAMSDKQPADTGNAQITFENSDPSVAEVTGNKIIGKSTGSTNIKAIVTINGVKKESDTLHIIVDQAPPVTVAEATGNTRSNGTYNSDVVLTLTAADADGGSGIEKTEYSLDGSDWLLARETGIIEEVFNHIHHRAALSGKWRWFYFDQVYFDLVMQEPRLSCYLNTSVFQAEKDENFRITSIKGLQLRSEKIIDFKAKIFIDCSGDGTVGYLAGADYRMGREAKSEYNETYAPEQADQGTMGATLLFTSVDTGHPVKYKAPEWAIDITELPSFQRVSRSIGRMPDGTFYGFWWVEHGGRLDSIHDDGKIIMELRRLVPGIWDYIKNSGSFSGVENLEMNWMGYLPGKRESRRLLGP